MAKYLKDYDVAIHYHPRKAVNALSRQSTSWIAYVILKVTTVRTVGRFECQVQV